jgi:hypothetical protein
MRQAATMHPVVWRPFSLFAADIAWAAPTVTVDVRVAAGVLAAPQCKAPRPRGSSSRRASAARGASRERPARAKNSRARDRRGGGRVCTELQGLGPTFFPRFVSRRTAIRKGPEQEQMRLSSPHGRRFAQVRGTQSQPKSRRTRPPHLPSLLRRRASRSTSWEDPRAASPPRERLGRKADAARAPGRGRRRGAAQSSRPTARAPPRQRPAPPTERGLLSCRFCATLSSVGARMAGWAKGGVRRRRALAGGAAAAAAAGTAPRSVRERARRGTGAPKPQRPSPLGHRFPARSRACALPRGPLNCSLVPARSPPARPPAAPAQFRAQDHSPAPSIFPQGATRRAGARRRPSCG